MLMIDLLTLQIENKEIGDHLVSWRFGGGESCHQSTKAQNTTKNKLYHD
jgi:hypothetical protein